MRSLRVISVCLAVGAVVGLSAGPAQASASSWTVSAGNAPAGRTVSFNVSTDHLKFVGGHSGGEGMTCGAGSIVGNAKVGTGLGPNHLMKFPASTFATSSCALTTSPDLPLTVTGMGTWTLFGRDRLDAQISILDWAHMAMHIASSADNGATCSFDAIGSSLHYFYNDTHTMAGALLRGPIRLRNVAGCAAQHLVNGAKWRMQYGQTYNVWTFSARNSADFNPLYIQAA